MKKTRLAIAFLLSVAMLLSAAPPVLAADHDVTCESKDDKYSYCATGRHGYVYMKDQKSSSPCIKGRTWDWDRNGIWVDDGCRAVFRVESSAHEYGGSEVSDSDAKKVAGVVLGAALIGALVNNSKHDRGHRYDDDEYQGPRHTSYVPNWMVGRFVGYNPDYGVEVELTINRDGRVTGRADNERITGYINNERLHVGRHSFDIDQVRDGFVTHEVGDRHNEVYYRRR